MITFSGSAVNAEEEIRYLRDKLTTRPILGSSSNVVFELTCIRRKVYVVVNGEEGTCEVTTLLPSQYSKISTEDSVEAILRWDYVVQKALFLVVVDSTLALCILGRDDSVRELLEVDKESWEFLLSETSG